MFRHFDEELRELTDNLDTMGRLTEEAIKNAVQALEDRNSSLAKQVIETDSKIDELELAIDEHCIDMIARYQPVASDLRFITIGMKINAELERIADIAGNVAERVTEIGDESLINPLIDIPKLSNIAQTMVRQAIESFVKKDASMAEKVVMKDKEANKLRDAIQSELMDNYMTKDCLTVRQGVPLLLIARHLERICDHIVNIAEDVIYMVNATVIRHHHEKIS